MAMWRSIPLRLQNEWRAFYELDPSASERVDWGLAHIVQVLRSDGRPLKDFMLPFGDAPDNKKPAQTVEFQTMVIEGWIFGSNAAFEQKAATAAAGAK